MHPPRFTLMLLAATSLASAQSEVHVPAQYQSVDASSLGRWPGFTQRTRQQFLIGASHLSAARGRSLTSLSVRRDGSFQAALTGGGADLTLAISSGRAATDPSPLFAANRTSAPTTVFAGRVSLPASPAMTSANEPTWLSPFAVTLPFSQAYAYAQGDLCLDVDGAPAPGDVSPWWPIDYATDAGTGAAQTIGVGCGRFSRASTSGTQWQIGSTARLLASGEAGSLAVPMLGLHANQSIDLSFLGAPGCMLRVDPLISLTLPYIGASDPRQPGIAEFALQIPNQQSLLGASLGAQWLDMQQFLPPSRWSNTAGLTLSSALSLTLSATAPWLHGAMIETGIYPTGTLPDDGHVTPGRLPVMRFVVQ
jgi:hypothetical protein